MENLITSDKQLYYRLIALWAVCEGVLGGLIHGIQIPITGLTVGSAAVIIISLIGYYVPSKGAIIKATILVCIFKMMLSPHSPVQAYFAVFFQGVTGQLFFSNKRFFKTSCLLFASLALFESGVQKIITLTIFFGKDFWIAINEFITGLTGQKEITNYSFYIAGGYVLLHLITGIVIGYTAGRIPERLLIWNKDVQRISLTKPSLPDPVSTTGRRKKWKNSLFVIWIILFGLYLQSALNIGKPILSSNETLHILIRSALILFSWYFILNPILIYFLKKWLSKQKSIWQTTINEILLLIPSTRLLLEKSWISTSGDSGLKRMKIFFKIVLLNSLIPSSENINLDSDA